MVWCHQAPSHYLNHYWLGISKVEWHLYQDIIIRRSDDISQVKNIENCIFKSASRFHMSQWVNRDVFETFDCKISAILFRFRCVKWCCQWVLGELQSASYPIPAPILRDLLVLAPKTQMAIGRPSRIQANPVITWCYDMETFSALLALSDGNPPVTGWFPSRRARNVEIWRFFCLCEQTVEQTTELLLIWDVMTLMWRHYNHKSGRMIQA